MKFLVVGLGSMGKRRIRNLKELKIKEIIGFDAREDRRQEAKNLYDIKIVKNLNDALKEKPDAMIISTPPHTHLKFAKISARKHIHFFTEVNTMTPKEMRLLIRLTKQNKIVGLPSSNLIFHPSIKKMKYFLDKKEIGKPLIFNFHSGSYLPDWHPWERLQDYYVYKKSTGGGRDQIAWELSWIIWMIGKPKIISAMTKKLGEFKAKIYDTYDLSIQFENGVLGHVLVDVVQRPPGRICEIICEDGHMMWDYHKKEVLLSKKDKESRFPERLGYKGYTIEKPKRGFAIKDRGVTESYIDEIRNFIDVINGKKRPEYTLEDEEVLLRTMFAAEKSSESKRHIKL